MIYLWGQLIGSEKIELIKLYAIESRGSRYCLVENPSLFYSKDDFIFLESIKKPTPIPKDGWYWYKRQVNACWEIDYFQNNLAKRDNYTLLNEMAFIEGPIEPPKSDER